MNNQTILQICPRLNSGGIERGTVDVAIALKKAGYPTIVASGGGNMVNELVDAGVHHIDIPLYLKSPYHILKNAKLLRKLIIEQQIALVHARSRAPTWAAKCATSSLAIPLVTSCHSPHGAGFLNIKKLYNRPIASGDRVIAISDFITDYLKHNYQVPSRTLRRIYRGIDTEQFDPTRFSTQDCNTFKKQQHIPLDKKIVLLPGRITRWKGQDIFIKALAPLMKKYAIHGVIVGRVDSHEFNKELHTLISHLNLENHVSFIHESLNMPLIYAIADITVSASRKAEAFGRVAVEAQAMKSLIIATKLGAAVETVLPDKTGFLVAADDEKLLSTAIAHALELPAERIQTITHNASLHVKAHFNKQQMLSQTLQVYQELLQQDS